MGGGYWNKNDFVKYSRTRGRRVTIDGRIDISMIRDARDMYENVHLAKELDPKNVMRECCDSTEHPETIPVILALDVTGSMGKSLIKTAASLNEIMQHALREFKDVEFMIMGIGDLFYDKAPIQISQFESDVRIARHLDKIWFERGGGGNASESYSAAWYMGLLHTSLDCWKRGKKGIIITLGDEPLNPLLPARRLGQITGDDLSADIDTRILHIAACEKFDIFHIAVDDEGNCFHGYKNLIAKTFGPLLGDRLRVSTIDALPAAIISCLRECGARDNVARYGRGIEYAGNQNCVRGFLR
ncbi:MAG: VWA domain-containing protein [Lachnospiraceae bacterium]|nr:VWA domain-containing protein [Lachnospiraceae bacterium]